MNHVTRTTQWERPVRPAAGQTVAAGSEATSPSGADAPTTAAFTPNAAAGSSGAGRRSRAPPPPPGAGQSPDAQSPVSVTSAQADSSQNSSASSQRERDSRDREGRERVERAGAGDRTERAANGNVNGATERGSQRRRSTRHRNYMSRSQLHRAVELPDGYGKSFFTLDVSLFCLTFTPWLMYSCQQYLTHD